MATEVGLYPKVTDDERSVDANREGCDGLSPMEAIFVPFEKANPYQDQLANSLSRLNVTVTSRRNIDGLIRESLTGKGLRGVIHFHWLPHYGPSVLDQIRVQFFLVRLNALRRLGWKIAWTVHNLHHHESESRNADHRVAKHVASVANTLFVHSEIAKNLTVETLDLKDTEKIVTIPHGHYIDTYPNAVSRAEALERLGMQPATCRFLFLGNIRPYKGVLELVRSYREAAFSDSSLVVAGRPMNEQWVRDVEAEAGDDPSIYLNLHFISDEMIQYFMSVSDVVVFPYRNILTSGALVLAMSFAKACIAPRIGCIPDVLDGHGGILYEPNDEDSLKDSLRQARLRLEELQAMGAHNLERATQWDWDRIALTTRRSFDAK